MTINFDSLSIVNGRGFKEESFPLRRQGLVSIVGKVGAGKTTIWDLMESVVFGNTSKGYKKDELTKNLSDTAYTLNFEGENGHIYQVVHERRKKKWRYRITEDDKDISPHNYNDAPKALRQILPYSRDEFGGSVHLSQGSQHVLLHGQPKERNLYISKMFGLDDSGEFGTLQKEAEGELAKVKAKILDFEKTDVERGILEAKLVELPDPAEDIEKAQASIAQYQQAAQSWRVYKQTVDQALSSWATIERLSPQLGSDPDPSSSLAETHRLDGELKVLLAAADAAVRSNQDASVHNQRGETYANNLQSLLAQYPDLETFSAQELSTLQQRAQTWQRLAPHLKQWETVQHYPDLEEPTKDLEDRVNEADFHVRSISARLAACASGECPTCKAQYSAHDLEKLKAEAEAAARQLALDKSGLAALREQNRLAREKAELSRILASFPGPHSHFGTADSERMTRLQELSRVHGSLGQLRAVVESFVPKFLVEVPSTSHVESKRQELAQQRVALEAAIRARSQMPPPPELDKASALAALQQCQEQLPVIESSLAALQQELGKLQRVSQDRGRMFDSIERANHKLEGMPALMKDRMFWETMVKAYGPKGLRVKRLSDVMGLVMQRLPFYTSILFRERGLSFSCSVESDSIEIIAHRLEFDGEKEIEFTHDIGAFSGGESKLMSIALMLTLASCVPSKKKANILVLDEIDAHLDMESQSRFVNDLLPALRDQYESLFVISHSSEVQQAAIYDQVWEVTKDQHTSSVIRRAAV